MLTLLCTVSSLPRPTVLLVSSLLALTSAAPALAQSAGDEQYSDPLAGQPSVKPSKPAKPSRPATPSRSSTPSLTPTPQPSSSGSGSSGSRTATQPATRAPSAPPAAARTATAASSSAKQLPRTGFDTIVVAALGAALLLLGIGLRLRTADARF
jgi:LPXTG-motif cell wall-anchored protein